MDFLFWIRPSFSIGNLTITWYAIFILTGVILALIMGVKEGKKLGIAPDYIYTGLIIVLPIAIIGARLWYVLFNINSFNDFFEVLGFRNGQFIGLSGLAIQGGVIAALIAVYIYCKKRNMKLYRVLDLVDPGFLIGQILGRWGNFCNHELYGPLIQTEWYRNFIYNIPLIGENMCFTVNGGSVVQSSNIINLRHPTFLYESLLNLVGLIIMLVARRKFNKLNSGDLMGFYLVWYGIVRIFTESLRSMSGANEILMLGPIPVSIAISIIFIICGIAFLVLKRFFGPKDNYQAIIEMVAENRIDTVLFDLDGTLLNTKPLIDKSFIHTFEHFRPDYVLSDEELDSFFGPTLYQSFSRYSNDEKEIEEMIQYYRDFNIPNHDEMVTPFPGAVDTIKNLHKKGIKVGVVSSKKTDLVKHGLELFGILEYMDIVIGADEVSNHKPAPDGILLAKEKLNSKNVLYVGDTKGDILAGKNANVKTCGVLYIKHPEIMLEVAPDYVINKLNEINNICGV